MTGGVGDYPAGTTPEPEHDTFPFAFAPRFFGRQDFSHLNELITLRHANC